MSSFLLVVDRETSGGGLLIEPVAAISAFPPPALPALVHLRQQCGWLDSPKDLEGGRVGLRTWQATAGLWARGILWTSTASNSERSRG